MQFFPNSTGRYKDQRNFTLIELGVVIAIIMLVTGIAIVTIARIPAGAVMVNTVAKVEELMVSAQVQSAMQGVQKNINFSPEKKVLYISEPGSEDPDEEQNAFGGDDEPVKSGRNSYVINGDIKVEFPDYQEEQVQYRFFPDGSACGPDMILSLKGQKRLISVSPLTGIVFIKEVDNE